MSISSDFSEAGRFSARKTVGSLEKSNFSQTCNLLSQYLKEKGSFRDLSLGISSNLEVKGNPESFLHTTTTMNFLPREASGISERQAASLSRNMKSMDLFPQHAGFGRSDSTENIPKKADFRPENAQMTIFYAGRVIVLDNLSADKAKEVMLLANKASSQNSSTDGQNSGGFVASGTNFSGNNSTQEQFQRPPQANVSDLPIARKASLHRFLEKRKDRISAKAPYQLNNSASAPAKPMESKVWLGLASQSAKPFELQL